MTHHRKTLILSLLGLAFAHTAHAGFGEVLRHEKIGSFSGRFMDTLDDNDAFGVATAALGDLDGDGVSEVAVGSWADGDGGSGHGAVWILFLNRDGTVRAKNKISDFRGNFTGAIDDADFFGLSVSSIGDLDGDEVPDLAVGAVGDDDGGPDRGAVWLLFLNRDGTVKSHQKISATQGNFTGTLVDNGAFGRSIAAPGDVDGDLVQDIVVGAFWDDDGGPDRGAVWVLFLNHDGTVKTQQKISATRGNFGGMLDDGDFFGVSAAAIGDRDDDGVGDVAISAYGDDDGGPERGAVWLLFLNRDGTVKTHGKISSTAGGFVGPLDDLDRFGGSVCLLGDVDGDGARDLAVGAWNDSDGGAGRGSVWVVLLHPNGTVKGRQKISDTRGRFFGTLDNRDLFGTAVVPLGDLDGDGVVDVAVGATGDDDGGNDSFANRGALWVLFLDNSGQVKSFQKISDAAGNFAGPLDNGDDFGRSAAWLGDLDGDGVGDLAIGTRLDDDGGKDRGAVWVLFMNRDGTPKAFQKISNLVGNFTGVLDNSDALGWSIASLGDIDDDGLPDVIAGAPWDDDGAANAGAVWILHLNRDGTAKSHRKISATAGGFTGALGILDIFGSAVTSLGDVDGDGVGDVAVGAPRDDDGGIDRGAVWILFMNADGTVKTQQKISDTQGGFTGVLDLSDQLGWSVASLGDVNNDGTVDIAAGAWWDDDGGFNRGAVWILFLNPDGTVKSQQKISATQGNFSGRLHEADVFGWTVGALGDLDRDGVADLAVGAAWDDDGGSARGALWMLFLKSNGTVKSHRKISALSGNLTGPLRDGDAFGTSVTVVGDLDGDGAVDLAVGAASDDGGGVDSDHGALWMLFLQDSTVVPVTLQDYASRWAGDRVEITWRLFDVGPGVTFEVWRRGHGGLFQAVHNPAITRTGDEFVFGDRSTRPGVSYRYRVVVLEDGVTAASFETTVTTPAVVFSLQQNHPNPFNPTTTIAYGVAEAGRVRLTIYDVSGRRIRTLVDSRLPAGHYTETWDGRDASGHPVASGIYFYRLQAAQRALTRKTVLLK